MNCVLITKQAVVGSGFLPLFAYKLSFSPEKAQKSGLFYITFRILIGILTGKTFTENSSSRNQCWAWQTFSSQTNVFDFRSSFNLCSRNKPETENNAGDALHYQKPPSWTAWKHNSYLRENYTKTREEGLSGELLPPRSSIIWSVSSNHDSNHLHQNNLGVC